MKTIRKELADLIHEAMDQHELARDFYHRLAHRVSHADTREMFEYLAKEAEALFWRESSAVKSTFRLDHISRRFSRFLLLLPSGADLALYHGLRGRQFRYIALADLTPALHRHLGFKHTFIQLVLILAGIGTIQLLHFHPH